MAEPQASGLQQVRKSLAYQRMKEANRDVFEPKTIYFATYADPKESIDWLNCLPLKAAIVYHAITGKLVNRQTRPEAEKLLVAIAKECKSLIKREEAKRTSDDSSQVENIPPAETAAGNSDDLRAEDYAQEVDGVFLVVGFLSELKKVTEKWNREEADDHYLSTHSQEIVKDIIKIENQLFLKDIKDIVDNVEDVINANETVKDLLKVKYKLSFEKHDFHGIIGRFCWYYSPFHSTRAKALGTDVVEKEKLENLLQCLHFSLKRSKPNEEASEQVWRSPSARQLKRSGVRFEASPEATIDVEFSEPKLRMPALVYDFKLETVVGNLLAWECLPKEDQKPVTRYFQFMNELVCDLGDVRMMKKFGLIKGTWKNLQEVFDLVKRTDGPASYLSPYVALDKAVRKVWEYHDKQMKKFLKRHQPAAVLLLSSVAAASVIAAFIYKRKSRKG
ncbi:hypothetical protein COCNU_03G011290 [Cocos nucifera]|uniref:Uncharacterized protein n=1 Tax=Cocos nucifera TaxID=13894 RepID=A0A8K0I388_COCNU|nr:hypothetical protein COCNU_03G011290 [Cocos nucifera]